MRRGRSRGIYDHRDLSRHDVDEGRAAAFVRDVHHLDAGLLGKDRHRQMRRRAVAAGRIGQLAGTCLRGVDDVLHRLEQQAGTRRHHHRRGREQRHPGEILDRIVTGIGIKLRRHCVRSHRRHHEGVAVGRGTRRQRDAYGRSRARPVVDDQLLSPAFADFRRQQARDRVVAAARRVRHDQPYRLVRKIGGRDRNSHHSQRTQHSSHCSLHGFLLVHFFQSTLMPGDWMIFA